MYSHFVLVSNRNLTKFNMEPLVMYRIGEISTLRKRIDNASKNQFVDEFLSKVRFMKGPIYDSDYMPFEAHGYVVAGIYDGR